MGIHPPFEAFYIECMLWHSMSATRSIEKVTAWLDLVKANDQRSLQLPKAELFESLQNIVHQAAALSRYFWPAPRKPNPAHTTRAATLLQAFGLNDKSPLYNRDLRNGLEHFDEKLDLYLAQDHVGQFVPDHVDYQEPQSEVPLHIFKAFYTHPLVFVLLGVRYEMAPLVNEVQRIHFLLEQCTQNFLRLPAE